MYCNCVDQATGSQLGTLFESLANLGTGIVIAFIFSWVLTLAILAFAPFMAIAGYVEMKVFRGGGTKNNKLYEESGKVRPQELSATLPPFCVLVVMLEVTADNKPVNLPVAGSRVYGKHQDCPITG